jgi:hypothetical protein
MNPTSNHNDLPPAGLPPVKPPSGRFIVQLFLIPGLIVLGLVLVFAFGSLTLMGTSAPESYLAKLDNPNPDVRWRAAMDLAQVLKRPESLELASNPDFALDIAERQLKALAELEQTEGNAKVELGAEMYKVRTNAKLSDAEKDKQENDLALITWRKLRPQRDLVLYLTNVLGDFTVPVGIHPLGVTAMKDQGAEIKGLSMRRRRAVWALANLGNNMRQKFFGIGANEEIRTLTLEQKKSVLDKLAKNIGAGTSTRERMAKYAFDVLMKEPPEPSQITEVEKILAFCAKSDDIFLREETAMACNFWDGPEINNTLILLSRDDGHGRHIVVLDVD